MPLPLSTLPCCTGSGGDPSSSGAELVCWLFAFFVADSGSRGSSWQRCPILRFIQRAHGRSCATAEQLVIGRCVARLAAHIGRGEYQIACHMLPKDKSNQLLPKICAYTHIPREGFPWNLIGSQGRTYGSATIYTSCRNAPSDQPMSQRKDRIWSCGP